MNTNSESSRGFKRLAFKQAKDEEGLKGAEISPDGLCVLTSTGQVVQLFELPSKQDEESISFSDDPIVTVRESEPVYEYNWYPKMNSNDPATCCFASISKSSPIHLWDAYESNCLRASYDLLSEQNEPVWGLSIKMSSSHLFLCFQLI